MPTSTQPSSPALKPERDMAFWEVSPLDGAESDPPSGSSSPASDDDDASVQKDIANANSSTAKSGGRGDQKEKPKRLSDERISEMTVAEIKAELARRDLATTGKKDILRQRLIQAVAV